MPLEQKMVDNLDLEDSLKNLQQLCPKIQIKKVMGLADYTVKIFAEGCSIPIGDICEPLRECLTDFARRVYENDEFSLRLNVTGSVQDAEQIMEIRFLNKGVCVSYKIVSSEKRVGRICSLRRSLVSKIEGDSI